MTDAEQREAARQFVNKWKNGGDEMKDSHKFWLELLHDVLGVDKVTDYIDFEKSVKLPEGDGKVHSRRIDGYIPSVKVLIEQKGDTHPLDEKESQSGGERLTPYEQGKRYNDNLPYEEKARWIITCNFKELWIYDMNEIVPTPQKISVIDLQNKYPLLDFLVKKDVKQLSHEMEVSIKAGDIVGKIYDAFLKQYGIPETTPKDESAEDKAKREHKLRSLNALCVRLVFLFYAEDAGIFEREQFHDYMEQFSVRDSRRALLDLFHVLDQKEEDRDDYLEDDLKAFPYVNGGLFSDESIEVPQFNDEIRNLILVHASEDFNWRDISPTIFGAVFESTLNPETRRSGGMHYTSIENIHKVIDPLFLDDLKSEFEEIKNISVPRSKKAKLKTFQKKLSSLTFLDPACGSGNFLTESYLSLRRLENQVIRELAHGQMAMVSDEFDNPIQVSIQQFYGIEINDFAATVAKTALWIAESQMLDETKNILYGFNQDFLPLKTYVNITEGNALRLDWRQTVANGKVSYIMGNPPFVGQAMRSKQQAADLQNVFAPSKSWGKLDYVAGWFKKAADFIDGSDTEVAFVSSNSICQGESVNLLWEPLLTGGIKINFAYQTFKWTSEAKEQAAVMCVIIGFSRKDRKEKLLFVDNECRKVKHINGYLNDGPDVFIKNRSKSINKGLAKVVQGSPPADNGRLMLSTEERQEFIEKYPILEDVIHPFIGSREFLNDVTYSRFCFWFVGKKISDYANIPELTARLDYIREYRKASPVDRIQKTADTPNVIKISS
ncbi:DNA methyltransferase [Lactimicrobium massiliense]|uniref:DNA methyltransferase n=1 Tax=Lactimicrobium massiliense TaxID=2161814 RepID=UPI000D561AB9|nr:DNA methyltransferase [Lactimicrobium massiliense]